MDEDGSYLSFDLICPECGVGNPEGALKCLVCGRDLEKTVAFMEDDFFDLEVTHDLLIEYRKSFWGNRRTGKVNKYCRDQMEDVEFGSPVNRLIFNYEGKRVVLPLRDENTIELKKIFKAS